MFELEQLSAFHFLRPWWLLALIPLAFSMLYVKRLKDPVAQWHKTIAPHLLKALTVSRSHGSWFNPVNLSFIAILLGVVSVAGPSWERQASPFVEDEAVLVIALDLSNSMNQLDIQPTRLERAKQKIEDLLKLRGGSRTGLVVYSGTAHSVIPLTNDPDIIYQFLSAVVTDMMPTPGKLPEKILPIADQMLRESVVPGTVLLMGDGLSSESSLAFKDYFSRAQHQLLILGVGLAEASEPQTDSTLFGGAHLPLQQEQLSALAKSVGGYYQEITLDKTDIQRINRQVNQHMANVEDGSRPWVDAGYYLLYPFALIFLFWFRKGWTLHWCLLFLMLGSGSYSPATNAEGRPFIDLWLTPDQQGRYYFEKGDYTRAAQRFHDPAWKGMAFYYNENFSAAAELFAQIDTVEGMFNLANAQAQGQNYLLALNTYDEILAQEPQHAGATRNRAKVASIVDEINQMSESQQPEAGEAISELGDAPKRAEGVDKQEIFLSEVKQLSADEILTDQRIHDLWMRQVQQDPSKFLSVKFQMQLNREGKDD